MKNGNKKEFSPDLRDLLKLKLINKLKDTYRFNSVGHGVNKRRRVLQSILGVVWFWLIILLQGLTLRKNLGLIG